MKSILDEKSPLNGLLGNVFFTFGRQILGIGFQFALIILIARVLGPEGNGLYSVALLLPVSLTTALSFGIPAANVYFLGRSDTPLYTVIKTTLKLWLLGCGMGLAIGSIVIFGFSAIVFPGVDDRLLWIALLIFPFTHLRSLLESILQGKQDFRGFNAAVISPVIITFVLACLLIGVLEFTVFWALVIWGIGQLGGVAVSIVFIQRHLKNETTFKDDGRYFKKSLNYGWKAYVGNIINIANYRADLYLVNFFLGPSAAGIYVVAVQIAERLWLLSQSVSAVLLPRLSELHSNETIRRQLTPLVSRWVNYTGMCLTILLLIVMNLFLRTVFGEKYSASGQVLIWLLPGVMVFNCARILASDIAARGRPEFNMWIAGMTLLFNVTGNILLIPTFGVSGAAAATSFAYVVSTIATLVVYAFLSKNPWWRPIINFPEDLKLIDGFKNRLRLKRS